MSAKPSGAEAAIPFVRYVRDVLGVSAVLQAEGAAATAQPATSPAFSAEAPALAFEGAPGARLALVSVHGQWPPPADALELRSRILGALKLSPTDVYTVEARKPRSAAEARELAGEIQRRLAEAEAPLAICFGKWALACANNDPAAVARDGSDFGALVPLAGAGGIELLLTHALEDLTIDPSLKKETWRHLQTSAQARV